MSRTGLTTIRDRLRGMIEAGTADYTVAGSAYWTDDQLDTFLDRHRTDIIYNELVAVPYQAAGSLTYTEYRANYANLEETTGGTSIFYVQDSSGEKVGTALFTVDYQLGIITFSSNQDGATYYINARSFDLHACAAEVWQQKAAHYFSAVNFSTDNHSVSREAIYKHCLEMANYYSARGGSGIESIIMERSDT